MLTPLWRSSFGQGVIDTSIDRTSQSLAIGDISGRLVVVDYFGNVLYEKPNELPLWGVAHQGLETGVIAAAVGEADKQSNRGAITLYHDDRLVTRVQTDAPVWDVCFIEDGKLVAASCWDGVLRLLDSQTGEVVASAKFDSPLFGLSGDSLDELFVCGDRVGILSYKYGDPELDTLVRSDSACYNIAVSTDNRYMAIGSHGPTLSIFDRTNSIALCTTEVSDVIAVKFFGSLLLLGDQAGEFSVRSRFDFEQPVMRLSIGDTIWNISIDANANTVFLAVGNGSVAAYQIDADIDQVTESEQFLAARKSGNGDNLREALISGVHPAFITSAILEDVTSNKIDPQSARKLHDILAVHEQLTDSGLLLALGVLALRGDQLNQASKWLSQVDRLSSHHSLAITLLARSLAASGKEQESYRILAQHIEQIDSRFQQRALTVLAENKSAGLVGRLAPASLLRKHLKASNTPSPLESVVNDDIGVFLGKPRNSTTHTEVDYGVINYIKYEYASRADHAKKILEMSVVDQILARWTSGVTGTPISLDIGCATCRWPKYFSARGFFARGYDIDPEAVSICRTIAEGDDNIEIELCNVLESQAEESKYSIITSMMGTFNHIPISMHHSFLRWIHDSLKIGGIVIFSCWNPASSYLDYLQFYKAEERRAIRENSRTLDSLQSLLIEVGLAARAFIPFTFYPDSCFEAWLEHVSEESIVIMDEHARSVLPADQAQMVLCVGERV